MKEAMQIIKSEIIKSHQINFGDKKNYFLLLLWPVLLFFTAYYSYKPLSFENSTWEIFSSNENIIKFLIIGYLTYNCFFSLVRNALFMRNEREEGILEIVFLSPGNRIALMYGRALGALIQNIWMFCIFSLFMMIFISNFNLKILMYFPLIFLLISFSACIWGGLMNTIFLFSRDSLIIFYILDEPMLLFSGVKIPPSVFPFWGKIISSFFPITYVLYIARGFLVEFTSKKEMVSAIIILLIILFTIFLMTIFLLRLAENHYRKCGNINFY